MAVFTAIAVAVQAVAAWTITVGGVSIAVGSFLLKAAVSFGTSAIAKALAGEQSGPENFPIQGSLRAGGQVPRAFVIGPGGTSGSLVWHSEWGEAGGTPNFYYTQVVALSDVPIAGLRRWFINGQAVTLEDTGNDAGLAAVEYRVDGKDYAFIRFYDGTQTAADPFLTGVVSPQGPRRYSHSRIGVGVAYAVVTFALNNELFSGLPSSFFELDGVKLYDVSKDSTAGGSGSHRWDDQSTWGGDGDDLPAVQAYNLARGIYFKHTVLSGALDEDGTIPLDASATKLSFEIVGGGGGGGASGTAGGATTVTLKDGASVVQTWTVQGGASGHAGSGIVYDASGEVSPLSPRGDGGRGSRGYKEKDSPPVNGSTGGSAGEYLAVSDFDISGLSDPSLVVTVGAGGSGVEPGGRDGGFSYQADVAPSSVQPQWLYGMQGVFPACLPAAHWIGQIGKCRNQIHSGSGTEPAFRCAGEIPVNSELGAAFEAILTSCAGRMSEMGGVYKIYVGAPDDPVAHVEDGDISSLAPQSFTPFLGLAETVNGITASYPVPDEMFALRSTPPLYSAEYEAEDGGRRLLANVQLSLVPFPGQAQRLVKGELDAARRARRLSFTLLPRFRLLEPGDTLTFTSVRNGFVDKLFRVDGIIDLPNGDLIVDITEVDPADHGSWEPSTDYRDVTPAPVFPVTPVPQTVAGFNPVQGGVPDASGALRGTGLLMQWDPSVDDVAGIRFQVRLAGTETVVARVSTRDLSDGSLPVTEGIVRGEAYEARAKYIPGSHRPVIWTGWIPVTASDVGFSVSDLSNDARQDLADDAAAVAAALDADFEVKHIVPLRRDLELQAVEQRTVAEALGLINGQVLWAVSRLSDVDSRLSDAGIIRDPETGNIRIYGLEVEAQRVSEVEVRLNAAEASLSLSATQAWVNQQISLATLDPADFPLFEDLQVRVNQVEIDLDAAEAVLALKASQTVVDGIDVRLSAAEITVDAVQAQIDLKADQSSFDSLQGRVQTAEVQISALEGPSISQTVADGRYLLDAQDAASVGTLQQLLQSHENRETAKSDLAYAMQDMRAKVDDDRVATAEITSALGAAIDDASALIEAERKVRSAADEVLASDVLSLQGRMASAESGITGNVEAHSQLATRVTDAEGEITAQSQSLVGLTARLETAEGETAGNATAVQSLDTRIASAEGEISSQAQSLTSLQTSVGQNSASVQQISQSIGGINAEYTLKLDVNGNVSGMVLRSSLNDAGAPVSEVAFRADMFAIVAPDGSKQAVPFTVYTEDRTINGRVYPAGVYMDNAYLGAASIGRAEIANVIKSDDYAQDANGIPTAGIKINFDTGRIKAAGAIFSRPMILAQGSFSVAGNIYGGSRWAFVNTGIRVGKSDVWQANNVALVAAAAITSGATAPGGLDPNNTFWTLNASIQPGARWNGFGGANPDPAASWRKDPAVLVNPYWATGNDQRVFLAIDLETIGGVYFSNPKIEWTVFQVT